MDPDAGQALSNEWTVEAGLLLSSQLLLEYNAFYFYTACAAHFDAPHVCLKGLAAFFKASSIEENDHAQKIVSFMNMRGLKVEFRAIEAPDIKRYGSTADILKASRNFEQTVLNNILTISGIAAKAGDATIVQFLDDFIEEQVASIAEFNTMYVNCARCEDCAMGLFLFDQSLLHRN